jgi:hypothetical protein
MDRLSGMNRLTRRQLLRLAAGCGVGRLSATKAAPPSFEEIPAETSGIRWVHTNAMSPARHLPETVGPGCAFLDYDNDGWMDILLVNSGTSEFFKPERPLLHALYKNNRDGTFTDVTRKAGITADFFGMGCAVADFDNDGLPDILLTGFDRVVLYRNNGDGTFTDTTARAGLDFRGWTTSAVWFDYNDDGFLDLFLCSFVEYRSNSIRCGDNKLGKNHYCIPRVFKPTASVLYRNNGDGTFTDVTRGTAIAESMGKALGVVATDINNDGRMDLFVANDTVQNFLFANRGGGKWDEIALLAEVGFSDNGSARSGMGVDAADIDNDGLQDLFVANVDQEMFSLYRNSGSETFTDVAQRQSIAQATRLLSGWGLKLFDFDNDGETDLFLANGHPDDMVEQYSGQVRYKEPLLLFRQENGRFRNISAEAGPVFSKAFPARGLAIGDFDNDGRIDVLIGNNGEAPVLLRNTAGKGNYWVGIRLVGTTCNRDGIGARIGWSANGVRRTRFRSSGGSYLSSHDPRMVLGLGSAAGIDSLEVRWPAPSKRVEQFTGLSVGKYQTLVEGTGKLVDASTPVLGSDRSRVSTQGHPRAS